MGTIASFLIGIAGSLAARVMLSLGFGIVSYAAINTLASTVVTQVTNNFNAMGAAPLALLNLAGGGEAIGIILAALVTSASLAAFKRFRVS